MAKAHLDAGVRLIWFETFSDLERILPVAKWIRSVSDAFIMTGFSLNMFGYTKSGVSMSELLRTAKESGLIDGVGFNCGIGPSHLSRLLKRQDLGNMIVYAAPNAGYADRIENRMVYRDNSEYFSRAMEEIAELGVNIIGGCCGTNPAYIEKLARTVRHRTPAKRLSDSPEQRVESEIRYDNNLFIRKLYSGEKVVIAELDPPFDGNDRKMGEAAAVLKDAGVEMITFSDSPMGKMRASSRTCSGEDLKPAPDRDHASHGMQGPECDRDGIGYPGGVHERDPEFPVCDRGSGAGGRPGKYYVCL